MDALRTCCVVARSLPSGTKYGNLRSAEILSGSTRNAEAWMQSHPCPERWNGEDLRSIVSAFSAIGAFVVIYGGAVREAEDPTLLVNINEVCRLVDRVQKLVGRLNTT